MKRFIGPCYVFGGNPTLAGGMEYLGDTNGAVSIDPAVEIATGTTDQQGRAPIAEGVYVTGAAPVVSVPFIDEAKDKLARHIPGAELAEVGGEKAILFPAGYRRLDPRDIMTLCLLPQRPVGEYPPNLYDEPEAWWITAGVPSEAGEFMFEAPEGDDIFSAHETQFVGCRRLFDQDDKALPEGVQVIARGGLTALKLDGVADPDWSGGLPAKADLAIALQ